MKKIVVLITLMVGLFSCSKDNDDTIMPINNERTIILKFTHNWDGTAVTNSDFNSLQFTNANGEMMSIERMRYLISNVVFTKPDGTTVMKQVHNLVDVTTNGNLEMTLTFAANDNLPAGNYSNVGFTFGLNNVDNAVNYPDLNSVSFNVPEMLGGGYHYMQMDGKFVNAASEEQGYNFHAIRAVDNPGMPTFPQDTFFNVNLGDVNIVSNNTTVEVKMNIAEWFKNPNAWDLNTLNQMLMPNSAAQILISENGRDVFSLGAVTQ
jgi:hypothetical protein